MYKASEQKNGLCVNNQDRLMKWIAMDNILIISFLTNALLIKHNINIWCVFLGVYTIIQKLV